MVPKWIYKLMAEERGRCMMTPPKGMVNLGVPKAGVIRDERRREQAGDPTLALASPGYGETDNSADGGPQVNAATGNA